MTIVRMLLVVAVGALVFGERSALTQADDLKDNFRSPPREYSITPYWVWNDTLVRDKLIWQIDQFVDKGIYGAFMHSRVGLTESETPYFSQGFWDAVEVSVKHGHKVGFRTWIYDEDKWPSGSAGGRTVRANPERNVGMGLQAERIGIQGAKRTKISFPAAVFVTAARVLANQQLDSDSFVSLTEINQRRGGGTWDVPSGEWNLIVITRVPNPHQNPDYINPATVRDFINNTYEEYYKRFAPYFGNTIPGSFFDEIGNIPLAWNSVLRERFRKEKGYDIADFLPMMFYDAGPKSIKVRCDYYDVFSRLFADSWFKQIADWDEQHNIQMTGHTLEDLRHYATQGSYFRTWRSVQIPGTDNEDFRYTFPRVIGSWKPKQISSVSHMYGKERSAAEALGGAGWTITLDQARYGINMLAAYGVNFYIFHGFYYTDDSGAAQMDDWPNSWFYQNPYWKYFKKLGDYSSRVSFLTSRGQHVADVAVLWPVEEAWSQGMTIGPRPRPNLMDIPGLATPDTKKDPVTLQVVDRLVTEAVDCDLADSDSVVTSVPVAGGRARIGTESYRVLILPAVRTVSLAAYRQTLQLAKQGLRVVALGATPENSAENGGGDPEVLRISRELFGPQGLGTFVQSGTELMKVVRETLHEDVKVDGGISSALRYTHRRVGDRDIYWLVNSSRELQHWGVTFVATGAVEKWDPATGDMSAHPAGVQTATSTTIELSFEPWEAYFIVFDRSRKPVATPDRGKAQPAAGNSLAPLPINGPWTLQLAQTELDYAWTVTPGVTKVTLPVMEIRVVRPGELDRDSASPNWRQVKLTDSTSPLKGASRYLSPWDAPWITRYVQPEFPGELGGNRLFFRKEVDLPFGPVNSSLTIAADKTFVVQVNGVKVGEGRDVKSPQTIRRLPLRKGKNTIHVDVRDGGYLLAQGEVLGRAGERVLLRTGSDWQVRLPDEPWMPAYPSTYPPLGTWGNVPLGREKQSLPAVIWYRGTIPVGAQSFDPPRVEGEYEVFVNDKIPLAVSANGSTPFPVDLEPNSVLSVRVKIQREDQGLVAPLVFHCKPANISLADWQTMGLGWYTGRGIYRTEFGLPAAYSVRRLRLDLGDLRYTGEVWLNGQKVDVLAWPPFGVDISRYVQAGRNDLVIVAANLLANQRRWEIFDSQINSIYGRWWHDWTILRESDHLKSGLLGPVRIVDGGFRAENAEAK